MREVTSRPAQWESMQLDVQESMQVHVPHVYMYSVCTTCLLFRRQDVLRAAGREVGAGREGSWLGEGLQAGGRDGIGSSMGTPHGSAARNGTGTPEHSAASSSNRMLICTCTSLRVTECLYVFHCSKSRVLPDQ